MTRNHCWRWWISQSTKGNPIYQFKGTTQRCGPSTYQRYIGAGQALGMVVWAMGLPAVRIEPNWSKLQVGDSINGQCNVIVYDNTGMKHLCRSGVDSQLFTATGKLANLPMFSFLEAQVMQVTPRFHLDVSKGYCLGHSTPTNFVLGLVSWERGQGRVDWPSRLSTTSAVRIVSFSWGRVRAKSFLVTLVKHPWLQASIQPARSVFGLVRVQLPAMVCTRRWP